MNLFPFLPGYENVIYETGREPALVMLVSFLITFVLTRGYTRIARVRGWGSAGVGGVHLHHLVVGVILALGAGALHFTFTPDEGFWQLTLAAAFGSGAALVLDEFALLFRLEDVDGCTRVFVGRRRGHQHRARRTARPAHGAARYRRGGISPGLDLRRRRQRRRGPATALKGKLFTAAVGVFLPIPALVGAIRLAKRGLLGRGTGTTLVVAATGGPRSGTPGTRSAGDQTGPALRPDRRRAGKAEQRGLTSAPADGLEDVLADERAERVRAGPVKWRPSSPNQHLPRL